MSRLGRWMYRFFNYNIFGKQYITIDWRLLLFFHFESSELDSSESWEFFLFERRLILSIVFCCVILLRGKRERRLDVLTRIERIIIETSDWKIIRTYLCFMNRPWQEMFLTLILSTFFSKWSTETKRKRENIYFYFNCGTIYEGYNFFGYIIVQNSLW